MQYHPLVTLAARGCFLIAMCGLLALGGCAGATPWNAQNHAGMNRVELGYDKEGRPIFQRLDGKGREELEFEITKTPDGTVTAKYRAGGVTVDGQALRAAVEQSVSQDVADAFPEFKAGLVDSLCLILLKAPC